MSVLRHAGNVKWSCVKSKNVIWLQVTCRKTWSGAMEMSDEEEHLGGGLRTSSVHESEPRRGDNSPSNTKVPSRASTWKMLSLMKPDKLMLKDGLHTAKAQKNVAGGAISSLSRDIEISPGLIR